MLLITGSTGYIGQQLVRHLVERGEHPRCLVRDLSKATRLLPEGQVEVIQGDTTNRSTLDKAVAGVDTIVHTAFITADRKEMPGYSYTETNVRGTANLIQAAE